MTIRESPGTLVFTFCAACSATLLASEVEFHVCRRSADPIAACAVEVPALLHIHQPDNPGRPPQFRPEVITAGTSTAPPSGAGLPRAQGGPNGGPNGGPMGRFVSREF